MVHPWPATAAAGRIPPHHWLSHCYLVTFIHNLLRTWDMATWPPGSIANHQFHDMLVFLFLGTARLTGATPTFSSRNIGQIPNSTLNGFQQRFRSSFFTLVSLARQKYVRAISGQLGVWDMVQLIAACTMIGAFRLWKQQRRTAQKEDSNTSKLPGEETLRSNDSIRGSSRDLNRDSKSGEFRISLHDVRKYSTVCC